MTKIKIWGWDKKPRTMLRFIKPGDIFCFQFNEQTYCFGRIIAKIMTGHVAEIFDYISSEPHINEQGIEQSSRLIDLLILDSYGLFDRKIEGEWRIIGHQEEYIPKDVDNVYFTFGIDRWCKIIDIWGNEKSISASERSYYPVLSPRGDWYIKEIVISKI